MARSASSFLALASTALTVTSLNDVVAKCLPEYKNVLSAVHTACKPPNASCTIVKSGLSDADKQLLLDAHNHHRSQVAQGKVDKYSPDGRVNGKFPPAQDMYRLIWDDEMANNAQALAEQCSTDHDKQMERFTTKFQEIGQNIGWSADNEERTHVQAATWVDSWMAESADYHGNVSSFDAAGLRKVITHFTQVIWANTLYVGCGYVQHKPGPGPYRFRTIVVCNYGPWGNQHGTPIYQSGPTCSACPPDSACDNASGLCVPQSIYVHTTVGVGPNHTDATTDGHTTRTTHGWTDAGTDKILVTAVDKGGVGGGSGKDGGNSARAGRTDRPDDSGLTNFNWIIVAAIVGLALGTAAVGAFLYMRSRKGMTVEYEEAAAGDDATRTSRVSSLV